MKGHGACEWTWSVEVHVAEAIEIRGGVLSKRSWGMCFVVMGISKL